MKRLLALPIAILMLLFSCALGLGIIHTTNFIHDIDMHLLDIPERSGYPAEVIEDSVDSVLDYLDPFESAPFSLPYGVRYSEEGASHFADCKVIFNFLYFSGVLSLAILILIFIIARPDKHTRRIAAGIMIALPLAVLCAMAIDFDRAFVVFHELLFSNSDWIFDPATDPVILMLPAEFFMHCGIFIAFVIILSAIILFFAGKRNKASENNADKTKKTGHLKKINSAEDLKKLDASEIPGLCEEIREFLIEKVNISGGHLASNLGVVEMTLAMHRNFSTPHDHFIWDVGHQSYVHKIITGRKEEFDSLRRPGGLSGFTKISESEHDCFGAGHSSTSLSAALGFAQSDKKKGSDAYTVVVLGDGAFTGGMIHEAINNCSTNLRLIILLNENEMSISKNKGGFADHLSGMRTSIKYFEFKARTEKVLGWIPFVGKPLVRLIRSIKKFLKNIIYSTNYFEDMGLYYMGPVDGNDFEAVDEMLKVAKKLERSTIIHLRTKKGCGYEAAERYPQKYHAVPRGGAGEEKEGFSENLGIALYALAKDNKEVCAITAAMPHGTGLEIIKHNLPDQFYDVGIAEEHAATFAAGLAANGMKPYFACYSSFLQRGYDNIIHDIALQRLPVTLCIDRCGLNEGDGATHHGIFDVSFLSAVPNMVIYTPATYEALRRSVNEAYNSDLPCAVRYPRGGENEEIKRAFYSDDQDGISVRCDSSCDSCDCAIITYGSIAAEALKAKKMLAEIGVKCKLILLEKLKPYSETADDAADHIDRGCKTVIFLEEGIRNGGAALCLWDKLRERVEFAEKEYKIFAIDDDFVLGEKGKTLAESAGICANDIILWYRTKNNL